MPEVNLGRLAIPDPDRLAAVVRQVRWPEPVTRIEFVRVLTGGHSGALVVQARVGQVDRVVKVDSSRVLRREWEAYRRVVAPQANACCVPIVATTGWEEESAAVVYADVGHFSGVGGEVRVVQEVFAEAMRTGSADAVCGAVAEVLQGAIEVFHRRARVVEQPSSLREANSGLGPSLTVCAGPGEGVLVSDEEVVRRSCGGAGDFDSGAMVTFGPLHVSTRPGVLVGRDFRVELVGGRVTDFGRMTGRVIGVRGADTRDRVRKAYGPDPLPEHADPFDGLSRILLEELPGRVRSMAHGDLNPRNIVLAGTMPHLIDYARTTEDAAQQSDFCWLEIGFVRDVLYDQDPVAVLRLQRALAVASIGLDLGLDVDSVRARCEPLTELGVAFRTLLTIRAAGLGCHPPRAGQRWVDEYQRSLLLAAHRTMKWHEPVQTSVALRLSSVVAGTAMEWLDGGNPFRYWDPADLRYLCDARDVLARWIQIRLAGAPAGARTAGRPAWRGSPRSRRS
ncbi:hypothetical protein [Actinokineospora enzanensis]|uniref:hypothetical protein n=1 Tax=Actinokineospora enzanensis TaxID=155975 RepID=UPI0012EBF20C|nr:hypothetical protein [Actinokineospora enzanensis]